MIICESQRTTIKFEFQKCNVNILELVVLCHVPNLIPLVLKEAHANQKQIYLQMLHDLQSLQI